MVYEKMFDEKLFLCVPKSWEVNNELPSPSGEKFARIGKKELQKLSGLTFITLRKNQHIGSKMLQLLAEFDISPQKTIVVEQTLTALALTKAGVGISLVTENTIFGNTLEPLPAIYLPNTPICTHTMYVAYPKASHVHRVTSEFARLLRE